MSEQRKINFEYPEDGQTKTAAEIKADIPAGGQIRVEGSAPRVPAIYPAMGKVMAATKAIAKKQTNDTQHFNFRGIDDVMNGLHQAMADAGVFLTTEAHYESMSRTTKTVTGWKNGREVTKEAVEVLLPVTYHFRSAEDGSELTAELIGEGIDYGDKGINKALSIALKYALLQAFLIPTEDMAEPDKEAFEREPEQKAAKDAKAPAQKKEQKPATAKAPDKARQEPPQDVKNALAYKLPDGTLGELYKTNKARFDEIAKGGSDLERDLCRIIEQYVALCRKNKEPKEAK